MEETKGEMMMTGTLTVSIGDHVKPDGWSGGNPLLEGDSFSTFRLASFAYGPVKSLAVEVAVTGRKARHGGMFHGAYRCRIVFVGDGEPDVVSGGWIWLKEA